MPVKISKVAKDLNVGTQTIIEFLSKKNITVESNPNARISDEHYKMLLDAFRTDKDQRIKSENFISERRQERSKPERQRKGEDFISTQSQIPTPKVVGKIDLSQAGKPKAVPSAETAPEPMPEEQPEKPEVRQPEEKVAEKQEQEADNKAVKQQAEAEQPKVAEPQPAKAQHDDVVAQAATAMDNGNNEQEAELPKRQEDEIFTLGTPVLKNQPKVIGKIDLSAINSQTRPKKKSKEEKRRERQEKSRQEAAAHNSATGEGGQGDRKKRKRIGKEKVDIEKSVNQIASQPKQGKGGGQAAGSQADDAGGKNRKNRKNKRPFKAEISDEDVQKQVKETLARLTAKTPKKSAKWRKEKREAVEEREREAAELEAREEKTLKLTEFVTANDLAVMMNVPVNNVIATCMSLGIMVSINQRLDAETINIVAEEFGFQTEYVSAEVAEAMEEEADREEDLTQRPPIVTVMGHVDHGKTSLLDYIRNANVIAGEAGGITQHIGAYNVVLDDGRRITFLDTPGHEAFTAMRARGAKVTDIAIIIVAADDNVMPQTVEAINHASAAGVPIVFAINKIDKPNANPDKIKEELANMNYLVEEWGGKYQSQDISAKKGTGVKELMEKVLLEAEMLDLKANPNRRATGSIIESALDRGRGYVATVLVENGTLHTGDVVLAGTQFGRVKAMFNERNARIKEAGPSAPVIILGLNGAPTAGDQFKVLGSEQEAREIATKREQLQREQGLRTHKLLTLDDIGRRIAIGNFQELNIIVKGDVDGSIEALSDSLIKLSTEEIQVNVLHKAVGQISESDVTLAAASNAIIVGFQVRPSMAARKLAEKEGVDIRLYSIIYDAIEEVKAAMEGMLSPEIKEEVTATVEVRETFHISKVGTVAGGIVKEGKIKRTNKVRLIRDGIVIYTGELGSLKRFKDDVKEVATGYECGLNIANYNDIKVGDLIEAYEEVEVKKTL